MSENGYLTSDTKYNLFGAAIEITNIGGNWGSLYDNVFDYIHVSTVPITFEEWVTLANAYFISNPPASYDSGNTFDSIPRIRTYYTHNNDGDKLVITGQTSGDPMLVKKVKTEQLAGHENILGNLFGLSVVKLRWWESAECNVSPYLSQTRWYSPYWGAYKLPVCTRTNVYLTPTFSRIIRGGFVKRKPLKLKKKVDTFIALTGLENTPYHAVNGFIYSYRIQARHRAEFDNFIEFNSNGVLHFEHADNMWESQGHWTLLQTLPLPKFNQFRLSLKDSLNETDVFEVWEVQDITIVLLKNGDFHEI